jgi:tRNA-2-methylthio-N6-dimethylallyladenosine synthase
MVSIVSEATHLFHQGYREVTLLGQNVDSYKFKDEQGQFHSFAHLLAAVALVDSDLRVRFSTSHPKDMTDDVLETMAAYPNICNYIHLPAQSGNSAVLERMNRSYTRQWYIDRIAAARRIVGVDCGISTDLISGFCGETDAEHADTLSLMDEIRYDYAYMYTYSERPNTPAAKKYADDVPEEIKKARLAEIIKLQHQHSFSRKQERIGKTYRVLVEGASKHGNGQMAGRNDQNDLIVFDSKATKGSYVMVKIESGTSATLRGIQID